MVHSYSLVVCKRVDYNIPQNLVQVIWATVPKAPVVPLWSPFYRNIEGTRILHFLAASASNSSARYELGRTKNFAWFELKQKRESPFEGLGFRPNATGLQKQSQTLLVLRLPALTMKSGAFTGVKMRSGVLMCNSPNQCPPRLMCIYTDRFVLRPSGLVARVACTATLTPDPEASLGFRV